MKYKVSYSLHKEKYGYIETIKPDIRISDINGAEKYNIKSALNSVSVNKQDDIFRNKMNYKYNIEIVE